MAAQPVTDGALSLPPGTVGGRLATAAGVAGLVFAVLMVVAFALVKVGPPPESRTAFLEWWDASRERLAVGTYLVPFTGMAFIWFVAAVRRRIGHGEGLFFSTVFIGSALVFVATLFAAGASAGAVLASAATLEGARLQEVAALGQALAYAFFFGFATKMAGMFMLVVSAIGRGTGALPPWLIAATMVLGVGLLVLSAFWEFLALVFPAWVAVVSLILIARERSGSTFAPPADAAPLLP